MGEAGCALGVFFQRPARTDPLTGGTRALWRVRLGEAFVMMLKDDLRVYYNPAPIARMQHGISQAVARHVMSHSTEPRGGWYIDTLITAVTGEVGSQAMRKARQRLREDAAGLLEIGVVLDCDRVKRGVPQPPDEVAYLPEGVPQPPDFLRLKQY